MSAELMMRAMLFHEKVKREYTRTDLMLFEAATEAGVKPPKSVPKKFKKRKGSK